MAFLEKSLLVHDTVQLLEGRFPSPGEVMVGSLAHRKLGVPAGDLSVGEAISFGRSQFKIAGIFTAPGTVLESEIWFDRNDLATVTQRDSLSAVVLRLDDAEFDDVQVFTLQRNDLELAAIREDNYYDKLSSFYAPIRTMTWLTAALVAAGAVFGGLNTLYAAFASRIKELATLQSIGFYPSCDFCVTGSGIVAGDPDRNPRGSGGGPGFSRRSNRTVFDRDLSTDFESARDSHRPRRGDPVGHRRNFTSRVENPCPPHCQRLCDQNLTVNKQTQMMKYISNLVTLLATVATASVVL